MRENSRVRVYIVDACAGLSFSVCVCVFVNMRKSAHVVGADCFCAYCDFGCMDMYAFCVDACVRNGEGKGKSCVWYSLYIVFNSACRPTCKGDPHKYTVRFLNNRRDRMCTVFGNGVLSRAGTYAFFFFFF